MDEGQDIVVSALQQLPVPVKKFGARINDIHYNYTKGRETGWNSMKLVCRALGPETGFSEWLFDWLWLRICSFRESVLDSLAISCMPYSFIFGYSCGLLQAVLPSHLKRKMRKKLPPRISNYVLGIRDYYLGYQEGKAQPLSVKAGITLKRTILPLLGIYLVPRLFNHFLGSHPTHSIPQRSNSSLTSLLFPDPKILVFPYLIASSLSTCQGVLSAYRCLSLIGRPEDGNRERRFSRQKKRDRFLKNFLDRMEMVQMGLPVRVNRKTIKTLFRILRPVGAFLTIYSHFYMIKRCNPLGNTGSAFIWALIMASFIVSFPRQ